MQGNGRENFELCVDEKDKWRERLFHSRQCQADIRSKLNGADPLFVCPLFLTENFFHNNNFTHYVAFEYSTMFYVASPTTYYSCCSAQKSIFSDIIITMIFLFSLHFAVIILRLTLTLVTQVILAYQLSILTFPLSPSILLSFKTILYCSVVISMLLLTSYITFKQEFKLVTNLKTCFVQNWMISFKDFKEWKWWFKKEMNLFRWWWTSRIK